MKNQFDFYRAGADVTRYHTVHTLQRETVGHHSHGVAMLCMLLSPQPSANLLMAAALHDLAEHRTGDIPSPAKRLFGIGEQVSRLEADLLECSGWAFPSLTPAEERALKLADIAQGALFCARELQLGNRALGVVFNRYMEYAKEFNLEGVESELFQLILDMTYDRS